MDEGCDFRPWGELIPDVLGLIFKNLSLQEQLTVIPSVCKSWGRAVSGPYCWQEIDIEEWSRQCRPADLDRMLQMLITRSRGSFRKLCIPGLSSDTTFSFIADHAKCLKNLLVPRSEISDSIVEQAAWKLSSLTFLDVSYCRKIGARALEAIGKHCKSLTVLRRTMHPWDVIDKFSQDDETRAIAASMPKLKHLEIAYLLVGTSSVLEIIANCRQLELLDVRGCWNVDLDEKFVKQFSRLKVLGPPIHEMNGWENCSEYWASSGYTAWDFLAGEMDNESYDYYDEISDAEWEDGESMEDVEMWFYDTFEAPDDGFDWPPSP